MSVVKMNLFRFLITSIVNCCVGKYPLIYYKLECWKYSRILSLKILGSIHVF